DGRPRRNRIMGVEVHGYAWQMLAYHAMVAVRHGLAREGMRVLRGFYTRMWEGGWPWSADLFGNAGPNYMTHGVLWSLPNLLAGATLDVCNKRLSLDPIPPATWLLEPLETSPGGRVWLPIVFPSFWGLLGVDREGRPLGLDVVRHF